MVNVHLQIQDPAQVTVGEQTGQQPLPIHHSRHAETLAAHFQQRLADGGIYPHPGQQLAAVHQIADSQQQPLAQRPARVREREVIGGETASFQQGHGQRVPHHQSRCGA
ncbi:hypothetical protein D3C84_1001560 [compost metagenome]